MFLTRSQRIRLVLKGFYTRVTLGHSLIYSQKAHRTFSFARGGEGTDFVPAVHIWSKGSVAEYWIGSQNHRLPTLKHSDDSKPIEPLLEYAETSLLEAGCKRRKFVFSEGALYVSWPLRVVLLIRPYRILVDARIAFIRQAGSVMNSVFFPDAKYRAPTMKLFTWSKELEDKVNDLQSEEIGANFKFQESC